MDLTTLLTADPLLTTHKEPRCLRAKGNLGQSANHPERARHLGLSNPSQPLPVGALGLIKPVFNASKTGPPSAAPRAFSTSWLRSESGVRKQRPPELHRLLSFCFIPTANFKEAKSAWPGTFQKQPGIKECHCRTELDIKSCFLTGFLPTWS